MDNGRIHIRLLVEHLSFHNFLSIVCNESFEVCSINKKIICSEKLQLEKNYTPDGKTSIGGLNDLLELSYTLFSWMVKYR